MILPEHFPVIVEAILWREDNFGDRLEWILLRVPDCPGILDWLFLQILTELDLEQIGCLMLCMKLLQPTLQDVGPVSQVDLLLMKLLLRLALWHENVFHHVITKPVRRLTVLAYALEVRVVNLVSCFLKSCVFALLEMLVKFWLVRAILDAQVNDLFGGLRIRQVYRWSAVEFDILGWEIFALLEKVAMNVEQLHREASRLSDSIIHARISRLGAVTCGYWIRAALLKELALLEMLWQVIGNSERSLDQALSPSMGTFAVLAS